MSDSWSHGLISASSSLWLSSQDSTNAPDSASPEKGCESVLISNNENARNVEEVLEEDSINRNIPSEITKIADYDYVVKSYVIV